MDRWEKDGKTYCTLTNGVDVIFQVNVKRFPFLTNAIFGSVFRVKCHVDKEEKQIQTSKALESNAIFNSLLSCIQSANSLHT